MLEFPFSLSRMRPQSTPSSERKPRIASSISEGHDRPIHSVSETASSNRYMSDWSSFSMERGSVACNSGWWLVGAPLVGSIGGGDPATERIVRTDSEEGGALVGTYVGPSTQESHLNVRGGGWKGGVGRRCDMISQRPAWLGNHRSHAHGRPSIDAIPYFAHNT
eukprot:scaffold17998_cov30-Tisochrysis_lutea.AAC.6